MNKMWYISIDRSIDTMKYYSALRKVILPFATTWTNLGDMMLSEISQTQKDKYHIISLIVGI